MIQLKNCSHGVKKQSINRLFIYRIQLTPEYKIHVINIDGVARVLTEEISAFLFEMDVLTGMVRFVRTKNIAAPLYQNGIDIIQLMSNI